VFQTWNRNFIVDEDKYNASQILTSYTEFIMGFKTCAIYKNGMTHLQVAGGRDGLKSGS
jgi:hypothetical protein